MEPDVCKRFFDTGWAAQVVENAAKIAKGVARRLLQVGDLAENPGFADLVRLEVLEVEQHCGQRLSHAIVELASARASNVVRAGRVAAICQLASAERRRH